MTAFLRRHPLALFLPLQALLGFWHLGLMSPWMDEAGTLLIERSSLSNVAHFAAQDVHPPLFYFLLYGWQRLPLGLDWAVQARVLSALIGLLATVALDRLWVRQLAEQPRLWFLALWSLSPCFLLYTRMSRSYSLQVLLVVIGTAYLLRLSKEPGWRAGAIFGVALLASLYTHYAPGLAMLGAANILLIYRHRIRPLVVLDLAVMAGYAPWLLRLAASLDSWGSHGPGYELTGTSWLEIPVKLAYWGVSFTMGEAVPDTLLVLGLAVLGGAAWLLLAGSRELPEMASLAAMLAGAGIIGVARWVSYPFVPARMLFVLPFFLLLVVAGAGMHPRAGKVILAAMLVLSLSGVWCYFHKTSFRNKQYPMPIREIAEHIRQNSSAGESVILIDSANSDPTGMEYALGPERPFLRTTAADGERALAARLKDRRVRTVWFLRNTHDISAGGLNERFESMLRENMRVTTYYYQPYSLLERALMPALGIKDPPWYFHELLEFRR